MKETVIISNSKNIKGRGAQIKVNNRFSKFTYDHFSSQDISFEEENDGVKTEYIEVFPKSLVNKVPSMDIPMDYSMNPYQGCEHGCVYCYARTSHEYWGYGPGLDFERKIMIKPKAAELLRATFEKRTWEPQGIMLSGNTDCYQPIERKLKITRSLLEVCLEYKNPVGIITKNSLIERDIDLLSEMAKNDLIKVVISITTLDDELRSKMEPRTSTAKNRLQTIQRLTEAGIPVQILIGPVIPGLNSHEIPAIIEAAAKMGAVWCGYTMVRLNGAIADIFEDWIKLNYPDRSNKVLNGIREVNGGKLENTISGGRMTGKGNTAEMIRQLVIINRNKYMPGDRLELNTTDFCRPGQQLNLF